MSPYMKYLSGLAKKKMVPKTKSTVPKKKVVPKEKDPAENKKSGKKKKKQTHRYETPRQSKADRESLLQVLEMLNATAILI